MEYIYYNYIGRYTEEYKEMMQRYISVRIYVFKSLFMKTMVLGRFCLKYSFLRKLLRSATISKKRKLESGGSVRLN